MNTTLEIIQRNPLPKDKIEKQKKPVSILKNAKSQPQLQQSIESTQDKASKSDDETSSIKTNKNDEIQFTVEQDLSVIDLKLIKFTFTK